MLTVRFRHTLVPLYNRLFGTLTLSPSAKHLIDSYGLPPESAANISTELKLNSRKLANADSIIEVFKDYGFSNTQIAQIILKRPSTLTSRVSTINPKLQLLKDNGFVGDHLTGLIASNPALLSRGICSTLKPCLEMLKELLGTDDKVIATVRRWKNCLSYDFRKNLKPNIDFMVGQGMPPGTISYYMIKQPRNLLQRPERVVYAIEKVSVLGIQPSKPMFVHAVHVALSMSSQKWDKKMECFRGLGWSEEDILSVFRRYPLCLALSKEKIRISWNFFVNELKYDRTEIVANPRVLMYSLGTRVIPRLNVFRALKSMGLVREKLQFSQVLDITNKDFVKRYIVPNQDKVPHLLDIYKAPAIDVKNKNT